MPTPTKTPTIDWTKPESWPENWWKSIPKSKLANKLLGSANPMTELSVASQAIPTSITGYTGAFSSQIEKWKYDELRWSYAAQIQKAKVGDPTIKVNPDLGPAPSIVKRIVDVFGFMTSAQTPTLDSNAVAPWDEPSAKAMSAADKAAQITLGEQYHDALRRSTFFAQFYSVVEGEVLNKKISSIDDYIKRFKKVDTDTFLQAGDKEVLNKAIESISNTTAQQQLTEFLTGQQKPIKITPQLPHVITVEEIVKSLTTGGNYPEAKLPMPDVDALAIAEGMGVPPDISAEIADWETQIQPVIDAFKKQDDELAASKAGLRSFEMPKLGFLQQAAFAVSQPMQQLNDFITPYITHFNNPVSGLMLWSFQKMVVGTQGMEELFDKNRAEGKDPWHAWGTAYDQYELSQNGALNFMGKLAISALTDPFTYLPGWGLTIPGKALTKSAFTAGYGEWILEFNKTLWRVSNVPFDAVKYGMMKFPITNHMLAAKESNALWQTLVAGATRYQQVYKGKPLVTFDQILPADFIDFLRASKKAFEDDPANVQDLFVDVGRSLAKAKVLSEEDIVALASKLGREIKEVPSGAAGILAKVGVSGKAAVVSHEILEQVNDLMQDAAWRTRPIADIADELVKLLGLPANKDSIKVVTEYLTKFADNVSYEKIEKLAIMAGKHADNTMTIELLRGSVKQLEVIQQAFFDSTYALTKKQHGMMAGIVDTIDKIDRARWRRTLDRVYNTPLVLAYIARPDVLLGNIIEPFVVSMMEGIMPGLGRRARYMILISGITGDPRLTKDIIELMSTGGLPGGAGITVGRTILPQKQLGVIGEKFLGVEMPKGLVGHGWAELLAQSLLDAQNKVGTATRIHAVCELFMKEMVTTLNDPAILGKGGWQKLKKAIGAAPKVTGIAAKDVQKDLLAMIMSNPLHPEQWLDQIKQAYSTSALLREALIKSVSLHSDVLGRDGMAKAMQLINEGHILDSAEAIKSFADEVTKATLNANKQDLWSAADRFRELTQQFINKPIKDATEFSNYLANFQLMSIMERNTTERIIGDMYLEYAAAMSGKRFAAGKQVYKTGNNKLINAVASMRSDMEDFSAHLQAHLGVLNDAQKTAVGTSLSSIGEQVANFERFITDHIQTNDATWALVKGKTKEESTEIWTSHWHVVQNKQQAFAITDAKYGSSSMLSTMETANVLTGLPYKRTVTNINVENMPISAKAVADLLGVEVADLQRGFMESMVMQDKPHFVEMIMKMADSNPTAYRGFNREKLSELYDEILAKIGVRPGEELQAAQIRMTAEAMEKELITLKLTKSMAKQQQDALYKYFDNAAEQTKKVFKTEKGAQAAPQITIKPGIKVPEGDFIDAFVGGKKAGDLMFEEGNNYIWIYMIDIKDAYRRIGAGEQLLREILNIGETSGKKVFSGLQTDEGKAFIKGLEKKGIIALTPNAERAGGGFVISKGAKFAAAPEAVVGAKPKGVMFHGSNASTLSLTDGPMYASSDEGFAESYAKNRATGGTPTTHRVILDIKNPASEADVLAAVREAGVDESSDSLAALTTKPEVMNILKSKGFDGAVGIHDFGFRTDFEEVPVSIVFNAKKQVKIWEPGQVAGITTQSWNSIRQSAMDRALRTYYQMFADYTNESIFSKAGRILFPYWKYEAYRWSWLARTAVRHPGTVTAWDRYYDATAQGKLPMGGFLQDYASNITAGTVLGPMFALAKRDYPSYYENMGWLGEMTDAAQRLSFFPNPAIMTASYISPALSGGKMELGAMLPGFHKMGLNLMIASNIPVVSDAAKFIQERIFHDNFRDYYKSILVDEKQLHAGGTLADGIDGSGLWEKIRAKTQTPEEQALWDSTEQEVALMSMLRSQWSFITYSPKDIRDIRKKVDEIYMAYGFTQAQMEYMRLHNIKPSDIMGGMPIDIQRQLDQMWEWKYVGGSGVILAPPSVQDLLMKRDAYYSEVRSVSDKRIADELDSESRFMSGALDPKSYKTEYSTNWDVFNTNMTFLNEQSEDYSAADFQLAVHDPVEFAKLTGYSVPVVGPAQTLREFWYSIKVEDYYDKYSGEVEPGYLTYTLKRQAILDACPPDIRAEFYDWVHKNSTPLELKRDEIMNTYIRGYLAITRIVFDQYDEESKTLIQEMYSEGATRERKAEIREEIDPRTGNKLISAYESALTEARRRMRVASPTLDFWLYVFGYIDQPKTATAKLMVDNWEKDRTSILR